MEIKHGEEAKKRRTNFYIQFFKSIDSWEE
jgi:hypothetical protein